ncbi:SpoIIIAH-like family protein [Paenibacillus sp. R14(2021)]|uniref:SpoIIIAH-like family protein n=1 Tax=Paenibacillus sp. R14(2021) TaxID=2859228 RepID=UPI001C613C76|nr:SpoIIIAH-like family protein [Paenibacillus sp. R14(2021)]
MNNKRQTIWLVSMLSLMVILSAYYLFTEDVSTTNDIVTTDGTKQSGAKGDATEASGNASGNNAIIVDEVTKDGGGDAAQTEDGAGNKDSADTTKDAADTTAATDKTDQEVLDQLDAAGGISASVFSQMQAKRDQQYYEEYDKLLGKVSDTKQSEKDAAASMDQLSLLEDKSAKITSLEEELSKQFGNAAVVPDAANHFKVVVQSDKLERSQADSILTMAMKELNLTPDQLTIQFVK